MRYPEFLKENGRIGFIAPSFGCTGAYYGARFDSAIRAFEEFGYKTVKGPNCCLDLGIGKSNTPEKCAEEINSFFTEDKCDIIISCGGGETMCEDLSHVDFGAIKKAPAKWYMGYSDNTNLTFTLATLCDTASVYGLNAPSFGMNGWHKSLYDAVGFLTGKTDTFHSYDGWEKESLADDLNPLLPYNISEPESIRLFTGDGAAFSGRMLGGCLDCLVTLCGTRFDAVKEFNEKYAGDGVIWFLEACDLNPLSVRRALWQLLEAGWFDKAKGFIIGRPLHYGEEIMGLGFDEAACGILAKYNVPIVLDADLGHTSPMMPFITGAPAEVSVTAGEGLSIKYKIGK